MVPSVESVTAAMAVRLGWRWNGGPPIPLAALTVKAATEMQLRPVVEARRAAHALFVGEALGLHPASPLPVGQLAALVTAFRRMWSPIRYVGKTRTRKPGGVSRWTVFLFWATPTCEGFAQRAVGVGYTRQGRRGDIHPDCITFGHAR